MRETIRWVEERSRGRRERRARRFSKRRRFEGWRAGKTRLIAVETSALSGRVEAIDLFKGEERRERGGDGGAKRENKGKKVLL